MTKSLIDTNVLVYAYNKTEKEKHRIAATLLTGLIDSDEVILSIQNLVEFSRVLSEKAVPALDKEIVRQCVFDLSESSLIISYDAQTVLNALLISKQYSIHFFDALLVSTMQESGIDTIITENEKDFGKITWLKVINPF
ncbi:PIN domain-containing protein [Candidatus Micrarchaeota archaeon]|nr:PIN domain-containing protein [Candidatus Micrarchaeota archaeon]